MNSKTPFIILAIVALLGIGSIVGFFVLRDSEYETPYYENYENGDTSSQTQDDGLSITDEDLNHTVIVHDFKTGLVRENARRDHTGVAVYVEIKNNSEMISSIMLSSIRLVVDGNVLGNRNSSFSDFAEENDMEIIPSASVSRGQTSSGWLFFEVPEDTDEFILRYIRGEVRITQIGGDDEPVTLPARDFDIPLQAN